MPKIPAEKFRFTSVDERLHDQKFSTKPVGYFKDAFRRFVKNKSSVVAAIIILILLLYAIIVPLFCQNDYTRREIDLERQSFSKLLPKSKLFAWTGWDGCETTVVNTNQYNIYRAIGVETGRSPVAKLVEQFEEEGSTYYKVSKDSYANLGMTYKLLSTEDYKSIQAWQKETGIQVIYPAVDVARISATSKKTDANVWYEVNRNGGPQLDAEGNFVSIYLTSGPDDEYDSIRIDGDDGTYKYARIAGTSDAPSFNCRINQYAYFQYRYGFEPSFLFGTDASGYDIFVRLAKGAQFSFMLAIFVSVINLTIGAVYGAIEGYYGGVTDMVMERVSDVLNGVPFMVVTTLFQLHLAKTVGPVVSLLFAFVLTGWIGMASTVRMQFYRFKNQEYVLAARTLGANDWRVIWKHIFPNTLGTIITGSILVIPGVIFSESSLTYLGIVNLESSTITSVGTMLGNGRDYFTSYPHIILFPALFIALLEISFNLFGNGLRDAFNPSLRGTEE